MDFHSQAQKILHPETLNTLLPLYRGTGFQEYSCRSAAKPRTRTFWLFNMANS